MTPVGWVRVFSQFVHWVRGGASEMWSVFSQQKQEKQNHRQVIQFVTLDPRLFFGVGKTENFEHFKAHRVTIRSSGHEEKLPG